MPGWQTTIKLGRVKKELSFDAIDGPSRFGQSIGAEERVVKNAAGERFRRIFRRQSADFAVRLSPPVSDSVKLQLESMRLIVDEPLSFIFADDWTMFSDRYTLITTTTLKLSNSPYTRLGKAHKEAPGGLDTDIINIDGVFTTYDVAGDQSGTNFFTGGSYDAITRIITLGNGSPGPIGQQVFVNWKYKGALVFLRPFRPQHMAGNISAGTAQWNISLQLDGI